MSKLLGLMLTGVDQPQADQPNQSLAEGLPWKYNIILSIFQVISCLPGTVQQAEQSNYLVEGQIPSQASPW
eukprot:1157904-Pelagomonas_calceolata.AAC.8